MNGTVKVLASCGKSCLELQQHMRQMRCIAKENVFRRMELLQAYPWIALLQPTAIASMPYVVHFTDLRSNRALVRMGSRVHRIAVSSSSSAPGYFVTGSCCCVDWLEAERGRGV